MSWIIPLAFIGIYSLCGFKQSARLAYAGPLSAFLANFQIPAFISIMWATALAISWWSIAVFVMAAIIAGISNAFLARSMGRGGLVRAQPLRAIAFTAAAFAIWIPIVL